MEIYAKTGKIYKRNKKFEVFLIKNKGAELINNEIVKHYLKKKASNEKRSINFPNMVRLQEQIIKRDNKTYFFGVDLPGFYKEEPKEEDVEDKPFREEKSDDEEGKFQRFFITEEQNVKENKGQMKKEMQLYNEETIKNEENKEIEIKNSKLEERKLQMNENYDEFKKTACLIAGENREYENPINLNSAYKILKNIMRKPNSIDFEDFTEPHYMKPTSVIQKFKFNGFYCFFKNLVK